MLLVLPSTSKSILLYPLHECSHVAKPPLPPGDAGGVGGLRARALGVGRRLRGGALRRVEAAGRAALLRGPAPARGLLQATA